MIPLPAEDRDLSPYTGYTRAHWEAVADQWLLSMREYASPGHAEFTLPGSRPSASGPKSDKLESFGRSFLAAAARIAGSPDQDPHGLAEWYAQGLDHGTRPGGPEQWGKGVSVTDYPIDGISQPIVEVSAIAFALALCREQLWDHLDSEVQERVVEYLTHHAQLQAWPSNWLLFTAITEAFLTSVGADVPGAHAAEDVERVESWYLGHGWYNDGSTDAGRNIDHYNSWVIHPYLWLWYRLRKDTAPAEKIQRFRHRLGEFSDHYAALFASDGASLIHGRSLSYRSAVLAGPWAAGLEGVGSQSPGAIRRLASGNLRYFVDNGVERLLSMGWFNQEYLPLLQPYTGPGSPYWAGIGFLGLAAPADHPLWTETEAPQPSDHGPGVQAWSDIGWLIQHDEQGTVRIANHGSDHTAPGAKSSPHFYTPFYSKLGYSTHTSPGLGPAFSEAIDSHVALTDQWGRNTQRGSIVDYTTGKDWAASWHIPGIGGQGLPGASIVSATVMHASVEVRCHLVHSPAGWRLREGATAATSEVSSSLAPLAGWGDSEVQYTQYSNSSPLGDPVVVPWLITRDDVPTTGQLVVSLHQVTSGQAPDSGMPVHASIDDTTVTLSWQDGQIHTLDLGALFDTSSGN